MPCLESFDFSSGGYRQQHLDGVSKQRSALQMTGFENRSGHQSAVELGLKSNIRDMFVWQTCIQAPSALRWAFAKLGLSISFPPLLSACSTPTKDMPSVKHFRVNCPAIWQKEHFLSVLLYIATTSLESPVCGSFALHENHCLQAGPHV